MKQTQIDFLLEYFFKNQFHEGWESIATKLINKGECVVAGESRMWSGDIGNFIKTEPLADSYKCYLYKFDLEYFLSSDYFKDIHNQYIAILADNKRRVEEEYNDIVNL